MSQSVQNGTLQLNDSPRNPNRIGIRKQLLKLQVILAQERSEKDRQLTCKMKCCWEAKGWRWGKEEKCVRCDAKIIKCCGATMVPRDGRWAVAAS